MAVLLTENGLLLMRILTPNRKIMRKSILILIATILSTSVLASAQNVTNNTSIVANLSEEQAIESVLMTQAAEWNKGNIEGFMNYYWNNDSLVFISPKKKTYGWKNVLINYQKSYPDRSKSGHLEFSEVNVTILQNKEAFVFGKWAVENSEGHLGGSFHLLFRHFEDGWKIVMDYTN